MSETFAVPRPLGSGPRRPLPNGRGTEKYVAQNSHSSPREVECQSISQQHADQQVIQRVAGGSDAKASQHEQRGEDSTGQRAKRETE